MTNHLGLGSTLERAVGLLALVLPGVDQLTAVRSRLGSEELLAHDADVRLLQVTVGGLLMVAEIVPGGERKFAVVAFEGGA